MSSRTSLDVIAVKTPCAADWNSMTGDDRVRFCRHCGRHVHDLAALIEDEAQRLVCQSAGELCIRVSRLPSGKVLTLDYAKSEGVPRWRYLTAIPAAIGIVWSLLGLAEICTPRRSVGAMARPSGVVGAATQPAAAQCSGSASPTDNQPIVH